MTHEVIIPSGSAPPLAPYSPGVKAGETVYVSGVLAMDANGNIVGPGDIKAQTQQVIESIRSVIEEAMFEILFDLPEQEEGGHYRLTDAMVRGEERLFPEGPHDDSAAA